MPTELIQGRFLSWGIGKHGSPRVLVECAPALSQLQEALHSMLPRGRPWANSKRSVTIGSVTAIPVGTVRSFVSFVFGVRANPREQSERGVGGDGGVAELVELVRSCTAMMWCVVSIAWCGVVASIPVCPAASIRWLCYGTKTRGPPSHVSCRVLWYEHAKLKGHTRSITQRCFSPPTACASIGCGDHQPPALPRQRPRHRSRPRPRPHPHCRRRRCPPPTSPTSCA